MVFYNSYKYMGKKDSTIEKNLSAMPVGFLDADIGCGHPIPFVLLGENSPDPTFAPPEDDGSNHSLYDFRTYSAGATRLIKTNSLRKMNRDLLEQKMATLTEPQRFWAINPRRLDGYF